MKKIGETLAGIIGGICGAMAGLAEGAVWIAVIYIALYLITSTPAATTDPNVAIWDPNDVTIAVSPTITTCYSMEFNFSDVNDARHWFDSYYRDCNEHFLLRIDIGDEVVELRWDEVFIMLGFDLQGEIE